jgi:hypothetical protein
MASFAMVKEVCWSFMKDSTVGTSVLGGRSSAAGTRGWKPAFRKNGENPVVALVALL